MTAQRYAPTGPKHWQVFYDTLDKNPDTAPIPAPPESNPMTTVFTKYSGLAMTQEMTPKAALDAMQKDLEALWAKYKQKQKDLEGEPPQEKPPSRSDLSPSAPAAGRYVAVAWNHPEEGAFEARR